MQDVADDDDEGDLIAPALASLAVTRRRAAFGLSGGTDLDDEDGDGILGIVNRRVSALQDAALWCDSGSRGQRSRSCRRGRHGEGGWQSSLQP